MKALILAAGRGKRMDDLCEKNNKCLIKVAGKPLIEYSLECAIKIGFSEILIIVGHQAEKIINAYGNTYKGHPIKYVFQAEQKGLVHAIACAKKEINEEDFMLMLGDELMINPKHKEMIEKYQKENIFSICGILSVDDKNLIK
jgi:dTDP-glucose pyrophosphorylase